MASDKSFKISGTGCALVDYLYKPVDFNNPAFSGYFSKKTGDGGLSPGKLVFTEEFEKYSNRPYREIRKHITGGKEPVAVNIGGPSIVSLIHAAQMLHSLPVTLYFYGCKGDDEAGAFIDNSLSLTPLKIGHYKKGKYFTPFTDVFSDPGFDEGHGERMFINNIGTAWEFLPEYLDESFFGSDMVVFGGTALVPKIHASLDQLLIKAKKSGVFTIVNTVFDFLNEKINPDKPWPLGSSTTSYRHVDLLITDMEEALRLSGTHSALEALSYFKSSGTGAVIITHGAKDLWFYAENRIFEEVPFSKLPVSDLVKFKLSSGEEKDGDTTGCGDNFAGGVIASIALQMMENPGYKVNFRQALALGVASGGFACFYHGGTYFEEFTGQKAQLIEPYLNAYLKQTGL